MPVKINKALLIKSISERLRLPVSSLELLGIGGGSINDTYKLNANKGQTFFVKTNSAARFPALLEKEKNGLEFIAKQKTIRVPEIISYYVTGEQQFLILEWIEEGVQTPSFWKAFGEQLAKLHKTTNTSFGYCEDNYMGALFQSNVFSANWVHFFIHCRLQPQIHLATDNGLLEQKHISSFENLYKKLGQIFNEENPSLLHGDLWRGNFMCTASGQPVLIDPAVYFGHRNMDLGMTTLFGGFEKSFYESYHYHFPLPGNYQDQWNVCNLYPLLIHLNLFGSSYLQDIEAILKKFSG
ncbi:MAG: Fructosamine/Ketosamine-3-kinase [Chitinophagaceae bacterium]|nr:Fructosamine/Ketosamine-3-kinase [Chitinophagaceae bacterium]